MSESSAKNIFAQIITAAGTVLLVLAFLVSVIEAAAFDPQYYVREYEKNGTSEYVGVSEETLSEATVVLLEYLNGERGSLDMQAEVGGSRREYYNEREKLHMEDVRDLNLGALAFMWTGFIVGGLLTAWGFILASRKYTAWAGCFGAILGVLAAFVCLGIWGAVDFGSFWTSFHHVFFSNDLWLFDPRDSLLIRMFEEQFFADLVGEILAWFLSVTLAALVISWLMFRSGKKKYADSRN